MTTATLYIGGQWRTAAGGGTFAATNPANREEIAQVSDGGAEAVSIGPLIDSQALAKMERQVGDALRKGATLLAGGSRLVESGLDAGHFFAPTVLADVTPAMEIYREETFGPIAPVIVFDDEDQVVAAANQTTYGLAAYVYTNDLNRATRVTEAFQFGIIGVNDINPTAAAAPFGGTKESGLGREGGVQGLEEYLETKLIGVALQ